ncbi:bifunctional (p)ppGpp synthetase/guanosine-3',5'-bis(diphosphate) 3'-pyrophosphohydrolase, partial [Candidatus Peregrinibacteria bacterium]|nr:bifunctional (p)ppGpp synthetase/guanosine-3',5'-bis(diphosphate) 3'-pyrophosphohydrolase [Candidatus Peregrinibacteria bacterium]
VKHHAYEDILISALLHDVPEDTKYTLHDVKELFGEKVEFLVNGITKLSKVHYRQNMPERQVESLKKLFLHSTKDPRVILIKLADRLHNMRTLEHVAKEKQLRIAKETLEIFVPIANLLGIQGLKSELEDLCFQYLFPTEYAELSESVEKARANNKESVEQFMKTVENSLSEIKIEAEVSERRQNLYTIYKRLCARNKTMKEVKDVIAVKILVGTIPHCYETLGVIHGLFKPNVARFKDYIANPKVNKYQSLHTTVFGVRGVPTEVQIRTDRMQMDASYGIASSFFKDNHEIDEDTRSSWVKKIISIEKSGRSSDDFIDNLKEDVFQDRILVFTPKGETIDLPKAACSIDFAYAISTSMGNYASKAEVNGDIVPITATLKSGDVVSIITSKFAYPLLSWLSFVRTTHANEKIHNYLKKTGRKTKIVEGRKLLQKEFDIAGLGLIENMSFKRMNSSISKNLGKSFQEIESLLIAVGEGSVNAIDMVRAVRKNGVQKRKTSTEQIINIKVIAKNRFGLLRDISDVFYKYALDMRSLKGWASSHLADAEFNAQIVVADLRTLASIFDELEQIDDVKQVHRVSYKIVYGAYALIATSVITWLVHPFILSAFLRTDFSVTNRIMSNVIIYSAMFVMLLLVLSITHMMKNYIPYVRNRKLIWFWAFGIPVFAVITLLIDLIYFDFDLSWIALLVEMGIIYTYLIFSYISFKRYFPS